MIPESNSVSLIKSLGDGDKIMFRKKSINTIIDNNLVSLTHCKNCNRKLKEKRYNLYDKKDSFIGYRCPKCYKKYANFIVGHIVFHKTSNEFNKNNKHYQAYFEQTTKPNDIGLVRLK